MSNQSLLHYSFNTTTTDDDATVRVVSRIATARGAAGTIRCRVLKTQSCMQAWSPESYSTS
jgi:hypothetical protein